MRKMFFRPDVDARNKSGHDGSKIFTILVMLAAASPAAADAVSDKMPTCLGCHGESGSSQTDNVPSLGAQQSPYTLIQLFMFREKLRTADPMNQLMDGAQDADLQAFADAIAKLPAPKPTEGGDAQRLAHGKALAEQNHCIICHQGNLGGRDNVPRLAGQREDYLLKTLREYKSGVRHGYDTSMADVVQPIPDADFADLAYYIARAK